MVCTWYLTQQLLYVVLIDGLIHRSMVNSKVMQARIFYTAIFYSAENNSEMTQTVYRTCNANGTSRIQERAWDKGPNCQCKIDNGKDKRAQKPAYVCFME
jgi:hypothetical protein